ncbi:hypothetical protein D1007_00558 [Hordeum vulgare]|nr:hypothetical protein D1007_00558 [Hordeum vulgare]
MTVWYQSLHSVRALKFFSPESYPTNLKRRLQITLGFDPPNSSSEVGLFEGSAAITVKFKPNLHSRFLADKMEVLQERVLQEFAEIRATQGKLTMVDGICKQLAAFNAKLSEQSRG